VAFTVGVGGDVAPHGAGHLTGYKVNFGSLCMREIFFGNLDTLPDHTIAGYRMCSAMLYLTKLDVFSRITKTCFFGIRKSAQIFFGEYSSGSDWVNNTC
jgi:hypothetical protein